MLIIGVITAIILITCLTQKNNRKKRNLDTINNTINDYQAILKDQSASMELRLGLLDKIQELNLALLRQRKAARDVPQQRVLGDGPSDTAGGPPPPPSYDASQARESERFEEAMDNFIQKFQTEVAATSTTKF